jgi:sortase A
MEDVMKRPSRGDMPVALWLPLHFDLRLRTRRRRWRRLTIAVLAALGATLLAAGFWLPAKAELAQQLLNRAWADSAASGGTATVRPWPWADTWPVARLTLPHAHQPLTVLAGASGRNLAFSPALMDGSAKPGTHGVSVIAGHRDTHFRALADLAVGDVFAVERPDGAVFTYEVTGLDVVDSERTELRLDADESIVVLVTCWPFEAVTVGGRWRYLVTARLVSGAGPARGSAASF